MVLEEFADNKKKRTKSFALDEYLIKRLEQLSNSGEFGSQSAIVSIALYEFMSKHVDSSPAQDIDMKGVISDYFKSPEGKAGIRSVIMEAFTPTDAAHMKASKKNGNRPIVVDEIIE